MPTIAELEAELNDWRMVRAAIIRQLASGDKPTRAIDMAHKHACDMELDLALKLKRARKRVSS